GSWPASAERTTNGWPGSRRPTTRTTCSTAGTTSCPPGGGQAWALDRSLWRAGEQPRSHAVRSELDRVVRLRHLGLDPVLDENAVPEHEHQQRPQLTAAVVRPRPVLLEQPAHGLLVQQFVRAGLGDDAARPVVHLVAQPVPDRHRE